MEGERGRELESFYGVCGEVVDSVMGGTARLVQLPGRTNALTVFSSASAVARKSAVSETKKSCVRTKRGV